MEVSEYSSHNILTGKTEEESGWRVAQKEIGKGHKLQKNPNLRLLKKQRSREKRTSVGSCCRRDVLWLSLLSKKKGVTGQSNQGKAGFVDRYGLRVLKKGEKANFVRGAQRGKQFEFRRGGGGDSVVVRVRGDKNATIARTAESAGGIGPKLLDPEQINQRPRKRGRDVTHGQNHQGRRKGS